MSNRNRVKRFGFVSRMDNIQAAILNYRLGNLKKVIQLRRNNFEIYKNYLETNALYRFSFYTSNQ